MDLHVLLWTCEYVKSYKRESSVVVLPVHADEFTEHEAHVRFERNVCRGLSFSCMCAHSSDSGPSYEADEVGDRRRLGAGSGQEEMEDPAVAEQIGSSRNGYGCSTGCAVRALEQRGARHAGQQACAHQGS